MFVCYLYILFFPVFFWPFMALLTEQRKKDERGGVTRSKGPQAGSRNQVCCSKDKASVHGTATLPTELNSTHIICRVACPYTWWWLHGHQSSYKNWSMKCPTHLRSVVVIYQRVKWAAELSICNLEASTAALLNANSTSIQNRIVTLSFAG